MKIVCSKKRTVTAQYVTYSGIAIKDNKQRKFIGVTFPKPHPTDR